MQLILISAIVLLNYGWIQLKHLDFMKTWPLDSTNSSKIMIRIYFKDCPSFGIIAQQSPPLSPRKYSGSQLKLGFWKASLQTECRLTLWVALMQRRDRFLPAMHSLSSLIPFWIFENISMCKQVICRHKHFHGPQNLLPPTPQRWTDCTGNAFSTCPDQT